MHVPRERCLYRLKVFLYLQRLNDHSIITGRAPLACLTASFEFDGESAIRYFRDLRESFSPFNAAVHDVETELTENISVNSGLL